VNVMQDWEFLIRKGWIFLIRAVNNIIFMSCMNTLYFVLSQRQSVAMVCNKKGEMSNMSCRKEIYVCGVVNSHKKGVLSLLSIIKKKSKGIFGVSSSSSTSTMFVLKRK